MHSDPAWKLYQNISTGRSNDSRKPNYRCRCTIYVQISNFPARIRCYEIKVAESSKHRRNTISPSQSNERIWCQLYGVHWCGRWKKDWCLTYNRLRMNLGLPLSDFHGCACAIAKRNAFPSYLALLMAHWKHFCLISSFHGCQVCHEHENCPSIPR